MLPYFSRRVGLVGGQEVPILAGTKINGRAGNTNFGGLVVGTNDAPGVVADETLMTVARVKQNIFRESWVGALVTTGDPLGRQGSWLAGADFTYSTSRFRGTKTFLLACGDWPRVAMLSETMRAHTGSRSTTLTTYGICRSRRNGLDATSTRRSASCPGERSI